MSRDTEPAATKKKAIPKLCMKVGPNGSKIKVAAPTHASQIIIKIYCIILSYVVMSIVVFLNILNSFID